jgi:hypothetical protein
MIVPSDKIKKLKNSDRALQVLPHLEEILFRRPLLE